MQTMIITWRLPWPGSAASGVLLNAIHTPRGTLSCCSCRGYRAWNGKCEAESWCALCAGEKDAWRMVTALFIAGFGAFFWG